MAMEVFLVQLKSQNKEEGKDQEGIDTIKHHTWPSAHTG